MKNEFKYVCPKCKQNFLVMINPKSQNIVFSCPKCDEIYTLKELQKNEPTTK